SHVFIYSYEEDKSPEPIPNKVINKSALRDMIQPPKPKEGEPENQQPLGLGNRSRWQPLGGTGPEVKGALAAAAAVEDGKGAAAGPEVRTESILVFLGGDPTPSETLRPPGKRDGGGAEADGGDGAAGEKPPQ